MKRILMGTALFAVGLFVAAPAQANPFTPDEIIGSTNLANSSEEDEVAWLDSLPGVDASQYTKVDDNDVDVLVDLDGNYYLDVEPDEPGYFLLKFGGNTNDVDTLAFKNIEELTKLVWTEDQLIEYGITNQNGVTLELSHYIYTGDTEETSTDETSEDETSEDETSEVPEPALMSLLGLGLVGVAHRLRRR